jgi:hypothetical protein
MIAGAETEECSGLRQAYPDATVFQEHPHLKNTMSS